MNLNLKKEVNENNEQFIWRICHAKEDGLLDMNWKEVADTINRELGKDGADYGESAYRKPYQQAKRFYDAGVFGDIDETSDMIEMKHELEKEKVKLRDERNELKRILREQARKESFVEQVERAVVDNIGHHLECKCDDKMYETSDNDLIITLTDLHTGLNVDNNFNTFNKDVLKQRLENYLEKIDEVAFRHRSQNAYVVISEIISGLIHLPLRIEANQNVIEQFLTAADYIADFLYELDDMFNEVHVYVTPGNHSRVIANKNDLGKGENFDHLLIPYLSAKLQNLNDVHFHTNDIEESIAVFKVRDNLVYSSHGDKDAPSNVVNKLTLMLGKRPDIILLGHRHTNAMLTEYNTKVLTSGALSGSDNYCMDKRLQNKPEQLLAVVSEDGLDCLYDVKF